jgi:hypothetical protein
MVVFVRTTLRTLNTLLLEVLRLDSARREEIVTRFPENLRADFRDWSGVRGHRAYNRLESGEWVYRAVRAKRR